MGWEMIINLTWRTIFMKYSYKLVPYLEISSQSIILWMRFVSSTQKVSRIGCLYF